MAEQQIIEVDGSSLSIGGNLYSFIQQFRSASKEANYYWIDALCINQSDLAERNEQIQYMRQIYARAHRTVVWLGRVSDESNLAIMFLNQWYQALEYWIRIIILLPHLPDRDFRRALQLPGRNEMLAELLDPRCDQMRRALKMLFERPWWTRMWIYQEFSVSKSICFHCGPESIEEVSMAKFAGGWLSFLRGLEKLGPEVRVINALKDIKVHRYMFLVQQRAERFRHLNGIATKPMDLAHLLTWTEHLKATNPLDKLYAILGMDEVGDIQVVPAYEDSVPKVFTNFVSAYAKAKPDLNILAHAGVGLIGADPQFPSWVLDPRLGNRGQHVSYAEHCASASWKSEVVLKESVIQVAGTVCDESSSIRDTKDKNYEPTWLDWLDWLDTTINSQVVHPTGIPLIQVFFRTLIGDDHDYEHDGRYHSDKEMNEGFFTLAVGFLMCFGLKKYEKLKSSQDLESQAWVDKWIVKQRAAGGHENGIALRCVLGLVPEPAQVLSDEELFRPFLVSNGSVQNVEWLNAMRIPSPEFPPRLHSHCSLEFCGYATSATRRKRFFRTAKGYMGLGPPSMVQGDKVCIIFGCKVPLLLREVDGAYLLVGECYVFGMMQGEMIEELDNGRLEKKIFILK